MNDRRNDSHRRNATLRDVAEACGLSVATVSRYLNHSIKLPTATIDRIDQAIAALRYQPNPHARSLSLGRSETIGLVVPDIANPFFGQLAAAVDQAASRFNLGLVLCPSLGETGRELDYLARLSRRQFDGLLFATGNGDNPELLDRLRDTANVVILADAIDALPLPGVVADSEQGGYLGTRHLIEAGHSRLAFVGGPEQIASNRHRMAGFRRAIAEAGTRVTRIVALHGAYTIDHGETAARQILDFDPRPTAIFAASDQIALGLLTHFKQEGIKVGRDISVVTFDDAGPHHLFDPPLTAIRQPIRDLGHRAVALMREIINGNDIDRITETLPIELIIRESVKPPRS
jgi:LacI family transcriptional regulator